MILKGRDENGRIICGYCYGRTYAEEGEKRAKITGDRYETAPLEKTVRRKNLVILGADSQGPVVKETAQALGAFRDIAYLDDDPDNVLAIDKCTNYKKCVDKYPITMPSFGNCELRVQWIEKLE